MTFVPIKNYEGLYEVNPKGVVRSIDRILKVQGQATRLFKGRILAQVTNPQTGYLMVSLWKGNIGSNKYVHRLVAEAFIPNPLQLPEVNHIDAVRTNASRENLEWCTREHNMQHAYNIGSLSQEHRRNLTDPQLDELLQEFFTGVSLTQLASELGIGLSRFSVNMRKRAENTALDAQYKQELIRQKTLRNKEAIQPKTQEICQYTKQGTFIRRYASLNQAGKATGTSAGNICNVLAGRTKTAGGYIWALP